MTKKASGGVTQKSKATKNFNFPKVNSDVKPRIPTQGGVGAAEPRPTWCQDSPNFRNRSFAPAGETGRAPPLNAPYRFRAASKVIAVMIPSPISNGRL